MTTKILELDLANLISVIAFEEAYPHYRVLIRSNKKPLGWIAFAKNENAGITPEEIIQKIKEQMGNALVDQMLACPVALENVHSAPAEGISVVVCTRNRTVQLATCLHTLLALAYPLYEIIVIDNAPSDNHTRELVSNLPVKYVCEPQPGLNRARNRGLAEARYSVVAFTDDDVRVDAFWLQAVAGIFANKEVMGASGYVAPAELETTAQHLFELSYGGMGHGFKRRNFKKSELTPRQLLWASSFGIGANMAFRTEVFETIGFFDTALDVGTPSHGGGDVEMFHRLVNKGHFFVYEPSMLIWHHHRRENKALQKQIMDNGRSFGCYLLDCFNKKTVRRTSIVAFFFVDWLLKWNLKNLFSPHTKVLKRFSLMELCGLLTSPLAYWKTKQQDKKINRTFQT